MFPSSGYGYVGKLLELLEGCQGAFRYSRGNVGFLLSSRIGKEPHLAFRGELPGLFQVVARFSQFKTRTLGSARVASGKACFHACCEGPLRIPLQSVPGSKSLYIAEAGT